jgi:SpoVK/Ycf46/Vps4 family AAA+-type ATPase
VRYAIEVVGQAAMNLRRDLWIWSVAGGVRDGLLEASPSVADTEDPATGLENLSKAKPGTVCVMLDLAEHLRRGGRPLRLLRDMINTFDKTGLTIVLVDCADTLPDVVKSHATPFELSYPDEKELSQIVRATIQTIHRKRPIDVGISHSGFDAVVRNLRGLTRRQAARIIRDTVLEDQSLQDDDINVIIASKRRMIQRGGLLEYIQTPMTLDEIGGMRNLKKWLQDRQDIANARAKAFGLEPPRGVLMLGVQGAGKSLCAKAIATAWSQPLLRMDPSTLYASYIGQSESNLRDALGQTEQMSPVVLWIDEIEKAFASAASRNVDGGLSQRMFGTLLTWLQEHTAPVFVVATANDIEALPPELLRKGRFDEIFFVDLPTAEVRREIFSIHLKKRGRQPDRFDLDVLAQAAEGYSGAEIEQAILAALCRAFADKVELDTNRIVSALRSSPPLSVTLAEKVQALQQWARGRCVPAD